MKESMTFPESFFYIVLRICALSLECCTFVVIDQAEYYQAAVTTWKGLD